MKVTILGSGTSQGIPVIACECHVCKSDDIRDYRFRSSVLISILDQNFVIDSGPDFRQQMLKNEVKSLSAIIFTHEHKDHISGLDDVRAFNFRENRYMEVYCSERVEDALKREFHYVFAKEKYPGIPNINLNRIENSEFTLPNGTKVMPIEVMHYKMPVFGFRIGDFTYITDAKTISPEERNKVRGSKVLVINALHRAEHISHFNLQEALEFIEDVQPEKAYLTHISHLFGSHQEIEKILPPNVYPAYDGLELFL